MATGARPRLDVPIWVGLAVVYLLVAGVAVVLSKPLGREAQVGPAIRNATPSSLLGKRGFTATPRYVETVDETRVVRQSEATARWAQIGTVQATPGTVSRLGFPYRASIRCGNPDRGLALWIDLAQDGRVIEGLALDSAHPQNNGVFVREGSVPEIHLREPRLSGICRGMSRARLDILVTEDTLTVVCGASEVSLPYAVRGRPVFGVTGALETRIPVIDGVELQGFDAEGQPGRRFSADFRVWPWLELGSLDGVGLARFTLVAALLLCLALDLLFLAIVRRSPVWAPAGGPLLIGWIPLQIAASVVVTQGLGASRHIPLAVALALLAIKIPAARALPARRRRPGRMAGKLGALAVATMALYGLAAAWFELSWFAGFSHTAAVVALLAPLGILGRSWLRGTSEDAVLMGLAAGQLCLFPLVWYFAPMAHPWTWAVAVLVPWLAASCRMDDAAQRPSAAWRRWSASAVAVGMVVALAEVGLRADFLSDYGLRAKDNIGSSERTLLKHLRASWGREEGEPPPEWENPEGRTHAPVKPVGTFRILCLGSSSTYGVGTRQPAEDGYPTQLEHILRRTGASKVEVLNAGIPGITLDGLYVLAQEVLLPMEPDLVILYYGNNGERAGTVERMAEMKAKVRRYPDLRTTEQLAIAADLRWSPPWLVSAYSRSDHLRLFRLARTVVGEFRTAPSGPLGPAGAMAEDLVALCKVEDVPLLLVSEIVQADLLGGPDPHDYHRVFAALEAAAPSDVHHLDPRARIPRHELEGRFADSVHMDRHGYGLLAQAIADRIDAAGLVPVSGEPEPR
jgi:lysophospholipase L1-like esterase